MKMRKRREWFMIFLILPMVSAQYDLKNDLYGAERISFNPVPPPVVRQPPPPPPQHQGNARGYQAPPHAAFFQPPRSYSNSYLTNNYVPSNVQRPSGFRPPLLQPHSSANFAPPKHNLPHLNMIPEVFNDWRMAQLHEQHPQRFTNLANHDVHQQSNVLKQIRKSSEAVRRPVFTNAKPEYQESDLTPNHYVSDSSILSSTPSTQPTTTTSATTTTSKRASVVYESDFYNDRRIPSSPPASQPTQTSFETPYQASETATRKVSTVSHSNYPAQTTSRKPYIEPESYSRTDDYEASPIYQTTGAFDSKRVSTQYLSTSTRYPSYETENTQFKARVTTTNALRTAIGVRVPVQNPKTIAHSEPASYDGSQSYNNQVITNTLQQTTQQPTERYTQKTPSSNSRPSISLSEGTQALVSISQKQVNNRAGPPAPPPVRNNGNSWTTTKAPNSPIVVGTRVGQNRNHQNLGSSNTISNANEVNNIIVHIFLNAKDNKHPGAHASTKLGPFHGTFGVGTSHGGPGTNANPIVITKDFDRDRLRFIDSQTAENMMESGPTNIVEVKAMVSSPDQQIGSTLNRAVSTELDRAIPVVLNRFKGPASGMDGELRKELEQALVDEIAKNLGQTIDDISTDVTEDDLTQLIEEGLKEFESEKNEAPTSTSLPTVSSSITEETPSFTTTTRIIVTTSAPALTSTTRRIVTTTTHTTTTPTTTTSKPTPTTTTTTTRVPTTTESTTTTTTTVSSTTQTKPTTTTRSTTTTTVPTTTTTTMTRLQPVTTTSSVPRTSSALPSKPQSTTTEPKKATIDFDMENEVGVHNVDSAQPKQELEPMTKSKEEPTPPTDIDDDYDSTETDIVHNPEDDVDELPSDGQRTTQTTTLTNGGDVQMQPESVVFPQGQCPTPNNLKDQNRTDVLFLLDSSNSFDEDKFMHAITLILHTVDYFQNIGPDGVQFSLVQYNSEPYLEFSLRKHNCKQWLLDDIADTEYMTGKSMLGKALDKVSKFAFTKKRGDRLDAENVLIILTGGESDDRVQQPVKIAKQNNMTVLVIATLETDPSYLLNLAGDTENVFQLDDSPNAPLAGKLAERIKASSTNGKNTVAVSDNIDQMEIHQPVKPVDINDLSDEKDEVTVTSQPILVNKESNEDRLIKMECAPDGFQIDLNLPASFLGHVVVKGQEKKENCRKVILPLAHNSGNQTVSFFVANEDCEVQQVKSTKPEGMNSTMVLHLVHDPSLRTDKDRAYLLQCFVGTGETSEAEVSTNLDVLKNDITIAETISLSSVPPTCSYSIRKNSPDGPTISKATVGQTVYHRWECDGGDEANHVYGIQVHNCYASDDIEQKYPIVDNRGCSSDLAVLSDPFYEDEKLVAFAVSHAFGFKDTESLKFVCKLSLCTRDGDGCEGVTPPVCGKSQNQSDLLLTRRSRHQYSAIEKALTSALSTEVDLTTRGAEIRDRITGLATSHITLGVTALLIVALIVTGVVSKLYSPRSRVSSSSFSTADDESEIGFSPASSPQLTLRLPAGNSSSSVEPAADPRLVEFLRDFDRQRYV